MDTWIEQTCTYSCFFQGYVHLTREVEDEGEYIGCHQRPGEPRRPDFSPADGTEDPVNPWFERQRRECTSHPFPNLERFSTARFLLECMSFGHALSHFERVRQFILSLGERAHSSCFSILTA